MHATNDRSLLRSPLRPRVVDAILGLVALELLAVGLVLARASAPALIAPWSLYLASGAALLLALRFALAAGEPRWIALALLASLAAHVALLGWLVATPLYGAPPYVDGAS